MRLSQCMIATAMSSIAACSGSSDSPFGDVIGRNASGGRSTDSGAHFDGFTSDVVSNGADARVDANSGDAASGIDREKGSEDIATSADAQMDGQPDTFDRPVNTGDASHDAAMNPGSPLDGQRWEVQCTSGPLPDDKRVCSTEPVGLVGCTNDHGPPSKSLTFGGRDGKGYSVTLRLRGVVETKTYSGGTTAGSPFQIGGTPAPDVVNTYGMSISSPAQTYYINGNRSRQASTVVALDDTVTIPIDAGAQVVLFGNDLDCLQLRNCIDPAAASCTPYVIADIPPAPNAFDGQFAQIDVLSVADQ